MAVDVAVDVLVDGVRGGSPLQPPTVVRLRLARLKNYGRAAE
jgi:hypothetical protein